MYKKVAKTVVINERGEVLLLLRGATAPSRPLTWDLPGGIIDGEELPEHTAIRELAEEAGLHLSKIEFAFEQMQAWGYRWYIHFAKVHKPSVTISWEHNEHIWQNIHKLDELEALPEFLRTDITRVLKQFLVLKD